MCSTTSSTFFIFILSISNTNLLNNFANLPDIQAINLLNKFDNFIDVHTIKKFVEQVCQPSCRVYCQPQWKMLTTPTYFNTTKSPWEIGWKSSRTALFSEANTWVEPLVNCWEKAIKWRCINMQCNGRSNNTFTRSNSLGIKNVREY